MLGRYKKLADIDPRRLEAKLKGKQGPLFGLRCLMMLRIGKRMPNEEKSSKWEQNLRCGAVQNSPKGKEREKDFLPELRNP